MDCIIRLVEYQENRHKNNLITITMIIMNMIPISILYNLFELYVYIRYTVVEYILNIPLLVYLISSFTYTKKQLCMILYRIREEPIKKTWICSCYMNRITYNHLIDENPSYEYKEIYGNVEHSIYIQNRGNKEMICDNRHIPIFIFKYDDNYAYRLLIDKTDDVDNDDTDYNVDSDTDKIVDSDSDIMVNSDTDSDIQIIDTVCNREYIDLVSLINFIPSNVSFLSIEYTTPSLNTSIMLELPQNIYMVGTQILSAVFIARLLEYTIGENDYFDMDYKLNILDSNIEYISLLSHQYIELYENEYKIKDI